MGVSRGVLAVRVTALSLAVGTVVALASGASADGVCSGPPANRNTSANAADRVCIHLVRTLSTRIGLMTACATAIIVLTMVGLSRLAVGPEPPLAASQLERPDR
jgi:hypothetical protein